MSAHRIVEMLRQSIDAAGTGGELKAPILVVGTGDPTSSTEDCYLYLRLDPDAANKVLFVNHTPGTASRNFTGLTN